MHGIIIKYESHIDCIHAYFKYKQLQKDMSTKVKFCLPKLENMTSSRQYFACKRQLKSFFSKSKCEKIFQTYHKCYVSKSVSLNMWKGQQEICHKSTCYMKQIIFLACKKFVFMELSLQHA